MPYFDTFFSLQPTPFGVRLQMDKARCVLRRLQAQNPELQRILEIGPGWGELADLCVAAKLDYVGSEINHLRAISLSRRGVPVMIAQSPPIALQSDSFDAVVALNVLEHMHDLPMALDFLSEMVRVTRPMGLVCVNCPDLLGADSLFWDSDYTHNFPTSMRRLRQMFSDFNLEIVDTTYFSGTISGWVAHWLSRLAKSMPIEILGSLARSEVLYERFYRLRVTFLRNIFLIGKRSKN